MDYKYIEQLLERYFQCETTLKEEEILRAFFAQDNVPVWLVQYKPMFNYAQQSEEPLGADFDERIMRIIDQQQGTASQEPTAQHHTQTVVVKARTVTLTQRLVPLFKAAAIVAIILTLGNAAQTPWDRGWDNPQEEYAKFHQTDSMDMQPIQAENVFDTAHVSPLNPCQTTLKPQ